MGGEYSKEEASPRMVCWIDDNHQKNNLPIIELLKKKNIRVELFKTTEEFIQFHQKNGLDNAPFSALRIITDMNRIENGVEKKTAGYDVLNFLRKNKYLHPILIYQSEKNVNRTVSYLREQKISWVFAEHSLSQAQEFALFSHNYIPSNPIDESESRPMERTNQTSGNKDEKSLDRTDYDRIKIEFKDEVEDVSLCMKKNQFQNLKKKLPYLDKKGEVDRLPKIDTDWHCLLISELKKLPPTIFTFGNYLLHVEWLTNNCPNYPASLPLYCAVAVRLYSGPKIYTAYLEGLKKGNFGDWVIFSACLETAFYFLPPWKGVVWRGTNSRIITPFYHEHMKNSDFVYMIIGVTSTSLKKEVAVKFIDPMKDNPTLYQLYTNKGRDISALSEYKSEAEILLPIFSAWVVVETGWTDITKKQLTIKTRFVQAVQLDTTDVDADVDINELIEEGKERMKQISPM